MSESKTTSVSGDVKTPPNTPVSAPVPSPLVDVKTPLSPLQPPPPRPEPLQFASREIMAARCGRTIQAIFSEYASIDSVWEIAAGLRETGGAEQPLCAECKFPNHRHGSPDALRGDAPAAFKPCTHYHTPEMAQYEIVDKKERMKMQRLGKKGLEAFSAIADATIPTLIESLTEENAALLLKTLWDIFHEFGNQEFRVTLNTLSFCGSIAKASADKETDIAAAKAWVRQFKQLDLQKMILDPKTRTLQIKLFLVLTERALELAHVDIVAEGLEEKFRSFHFLFEADARATPRGKSHS